MYFLLKSFNPFCCFCPFNYFMAYLIHVKSLDSSVASFNLPNKRSTNCSQLVTSAMNIGLICFRKFLEWYQRNISKTDLCFGDPFISNLWLCIKYDNMGSINFMSFVSKRIHHLNAMSLILRFLYNFSSIRNNSITTY